MKPHNVSASFLVSLFVFEIPALPLFPLMPKVRELMFRMSLSLSGECLSVFGTRLQVDVL